MDGAYLLSPDQERKILEDPREANTRLLLVLQKFVTGEASRKDIQKFGLVKEVGGPNGKRVDWRFTDESTQKLVDTCLHSMGIVFKEDNEEAKWMRHNLWERARGASNLPIDQIQPLAFNFNVSWQEWLRL